jgi:hypothetical protein
MPAAFLAAGFLSQPEAANPRRTKQPIKRMRFNAIFLTRCCLLYCNGMPAAGLWHIFFFLVSLPSPEHMDSLVPEVAPDSLT